MAESYDLTIEDLADILTTTLDELMDGGVQIGVKETPAKNGRPAGILIFCGNFAVHDGKIVPLVEAK